MHFLGDALEESVFQELLLRRLSTRGKIVNKEIATAHTAAVAKTKVTTAADSTQSTAATGSQAKASDETGTQKTAEQKIVELTSQVTSLTKQVASRGRDKAKGDNGKGGGKGKSKDKDKG